MKKIGESAYSHTHIEEMANQKENPVRGTPFPANEDHEKNAIEGLPMQSHSKNAIDSARHRFFGDASSSDSIFPKIDIHRLQTIIDEAVKKNPKSGLNIARELEMKGYSKNILGVRFFDNKPPILKGMTLKGLTFHGCSFDWHHLSKAEILDCNFYRCELKNVSFIEAKMKGSKFDDCHFTESMFVKCDIADTQFHHSKFIHCSFEDAKIERTIFKNTEMPGTHFLDASIFESSIAESDLTDTVFFGKRDDFSIDSASLSTAKLTRPTSATLVFPESRGISVPLVGAKIANVAQNIPVRITMQTPLFRVEDVDLEVEDLLDELSRMTNPAYSGKKISVDPESSISQQLLLAIKQAPDAYPCALHILNKAESIARHVDSVVLPGGEDVSPRLYGEKKTSDTKWNGDYRRSILELGLIHQCVNKGIPLMAICRGFQITSAYFGAKLYQHIGKGQVGVQILGEKKPFDVKDESSSASVYGDVIQGIRAAVYHHQAVPADAGVNHVVASLTHTVTDPDSGEKWGVIMAVEQNAGAPILGLQFHPEFFRQNPSIQASDAAPTSAELKQLARDYVPPGTQERGLRDPADMIASGILDHMSADNDDIWKILAGAAHAYRNKSGITQTELIKEKKKLRKTT